MSILALLLVLAGSVLHLGWNIQAKRAQDKTAFLWIAFLPVALAAAVYYALYWDEFITAPGLVCLVVTCVIHVVYLELLSGSYKVADLSFVYPYSRGIGAVVATAGGLAVLCERPKLLGAVGITLSIAAMFIEPLKSGFRRRKSLSPAGALLTVGAGVMIGIYLVVDKIGLGEIPATEYLLGMFLGMVLMMAPGMLAKGRVRAELARSGWKAPLTAGFLIWGAYWTILAGMEMAPISYVAAVRSSGIVMSGFAGWLFLQEKVGISRWISIVLISVGVTLIGLA